MQKGDEKKIIDTANAIKKLGAVSEFKYHKMSVAEVIANFKSEVAKGLSDNEAAARLA